MPAWAGKWKGGRYYLDEISRPVYFIERRQRTVKLPTHDLQTAIGMLGQFLDDPESIQPKAKTPRAGPVYITAELLAAYLASISGTVKDHRKARAKYLAAWSAVKPAIDLRTVEPDALRKALDGFTGGWDGRTEALNAFASWLVAGRRLDAWHPLVNHRGTDPKKARAAREAYSLEQLRECYARLPATAVRDVFLLRAATGMHHTEIAQLKGARLYTGPLPDDGVGVRTLAGEHVIAGVLQVRHKNGQRHRVSVDAACLAAALRLREGVPRRGSTWKAFDPLVPSNLRHTFSTLAAECGELIEFNAGGGVPRARVAQAMGHRAGSTMLVDRYEHVQIPPMLRLPLGF
jgi:integrase